MPSPIAIAEQLLTVFDQGSFSTTYKYAVTLALLDVCLSHATSDGAPPTSVTTVQLADRVLALYWPHAVPFGTTLLCQSGTGQAEIVSKVAAFRERHAPDPSATLVQARLANPAAFETLRRFVEWKLVEMPLPRLQEIGGESTPFLFRIGWDATIKRSTFTGPTFDNRILLLPGVGEALVQLSSLLRTLIHREWTAMVQRLNRETVPDARLETFLFGSERIDLTPVRQPLFELQERKCFYCGVPIRGVIAVDHFIPWARHPDNGIHNLVVCDERCNARKHAFLASAEHVTDWTTRLARHDRALRDIAQRAEWESHATETLGLVRSIYLRLPANVKLWHHERRFVPADVGQLRAALTA